MSRLNRKSVLRTSVCTAAAAFAFLGTANGEEVEESGDLKLDPILVLQDRAADAPGMAALLSPEDLSKLPLDHPAEALNSVSGVNVQMNSQQEHLISIRSPVLTGGAGQGSFLLLENGLPMRAAAFGNVNGLIDAHNEFASAVEVVKGPGSARYGSNAVHGLINYLQPEPGTAGSSLELSASTLDRYKLNGIVAQSIGDADALVAVTLGKDNGWREASGADQQKISARLSADVGAWRTLSSFNYVNLNQETAGYINDYEDEDLVETNPNPEAYRDAWTARANVRFSRELDAGTLSITPFGITQRMEFIQHFLPYDGLEENGHDSVGVQAKLDSSSDLINWTIGADIQWANGFLKETQERASFGPFPQGDHYDYDVETLTAALFGEAFWTPISSAPHFKLLAGLRAETHSYDYDTALTSGTSGRFQVTPDRQDDFTLVTPKLGATYDVSSVSQIYVNLARGQRAPQASDLYRLQSNQVVGEIKTETLDSAELGWRGRIDVSGSETHWDVAVYTMKKDNFFFRDANGLNVPDGETEHVGAEVSAGGDLKSGLFWRADVSYGEHRYAFDRVVNNASETITDGDLIDTAPRWLADVALGYQGDHLSVVFSAEMIDEYFTNGANTRSYPGHTTLHANLAYRMSDQVEGFLTVRNLTDENYADRADFGFGSERYFPGEPLNATFGVRLRQ